MSATDAPSGSAAHSQTRLSTTISGVVFWGVVLFGIVSLGVMLLFTRSDEDALRDLRGHRLLQAFEDELLAPTTDRSLRERAAELSSAFADLAPELGVIGVRLSAGDEALDFGRQPADAAALNVQSRLPRPGLSGSDSGLSATVYFAPANNIAGGFRENLLIGIGGLALLFGLILNYILRRILGQPFNAMVNTARTYASGRECVRFDESRGDDFGFLAKFINMALQTAEDRQAQLEKALAQVEREKRYIHDVFSHYLSPTVVDRLVEDEGMAKLGGEVRYATAWFADLSGFTALSEVLSPAELTDFVNRYFSAMTEVVESHGGVVERYVGDSLLAIFGGTEQGDDHALQAVKAGLACVKRMQAEQKNFGLSLSCRIGINTGEMMIGNIGSKDRFSYTVMGDATNVASRLEGANKEFGTAILVGEATAAACGDGIVFREVDHVQLVGRQKPVRIFEPMATKDTDASVKHCAIAEFAGALERYRQRDFTGAADAFSRMSEHDPVAAIYHKRALCYAKSSPPPDWSAVTVLDRK